MIKCELCGSNTTVGKVGDSKYICTNKDCKRSNSNWVIDSIEDLKSELEIANLNFEKALNLKLNDIDIVIKVYEARFIGDGSYDISFSDGKKFDGYIKDGVQHNYLEGVSEEVKKTIEKRIIEIYELKKIKDDILDKIIRGEE